MINESKVVRAVPVDGRSVLVDKPFDSVTHADYKALEDELAALRGKVRELVEADRAFDAAVYAYWIDGEENEDDREAATERRRLALEALS